MMEGTPAIYLGRIVDKKTFRAVVYGSDGKKKLVKTWDEFESAMQSGLWFAKAEDAKECVAPMESEEVLEIPVKRKTKPQKKPVSESTLKEGKQPAKLREEHNDGMVYEVKDGEQ